MRVTVVRPEELGPLEAGLWATFQHSSPVMSSPFLSLTFAQAVGRSRSNAHVAVVEENGKIEAFLPFELASSGIAVPIGWPMNDLQGIIGSGAHLDARSVVRGAALRGWRFAHVPAEQTALAPYRYRGTFVQGREMDLTDGYQSYLKQRGKSFIKRSAYTRRSIERHVGPVSLEWNSPSPEHLRQLIDWKADKYGGFARLLSSDPTAVRIIEELSRANSGDCCGVVNVLFAGERAVAIHMGLIGPRGLCVWLPTYDRDLSRFSPGTMMWFAVAEEASSRGVTRIDFGYGGDRYKLHLTTESHAVVGGAVWASRTEQFGRAVYRRLFQHPHSPA